MPEILNKNLDNIDNSQKLSQKTKKLLKAFSLSVGIILSGNTLGENESLENSNININNIEEITYNELKYFFIQQRYGLIEAIKQKSSSEGVLLSNQNLEENEDYIIYLIKDTLKELNILELKFILDEEGYNLIYSKPYFKESVFALIEARYGKEKLSILENKELIGNYYIVFNFIINDKGKYKISDLYIQDVKKDYNNSIVSFNIG